MQIEKYIKKFRYHLLYQHVSAHAICVIFITTLTFVTLIQLESIFYFDPKTKRMFGADSKLTTTVKGDKGAA